MMLRRRFFVLRSNAVPSNEIWYTTSDGAVLAASSNSAFSTGLVSNTYAGGKGVLRYSSPLTSLPTKMFYYCSKLTSITIGNSVTSVGTEAFAGCSGLKEVHISDLAAWCRIDFAAYRSNPLFHGKKLYLKNSLVTNLVIPSGITTIKKYAFRACESITSVTIPSSVTTIDDYAFIHCTNLQSVVIPDSVTSIGGSAFEATTTTNLTEVTIGGGVNNIGTNAFAHQKNLSKIYCKATTPPTVQSNIFVNVPTNCVVYVPTKDIGSYQVADYWKEMNLQGYDF